MTNFRFQLVAGGGLRAEAASSGHESKQTELLGCVIIAMETKNI